MWYFSQTQKQRIWDAFGRPLGHCKDILVGDVDQAFPTVVALAIEDSDKAPQFVDASQVSSLFPSITLRVPLERLKPYAPRGDELWLGARVLDRQIVDTEGRRVVRVNDIQIARIDNRYTVTGVDVGGRGLLRRLGLEGAIVAAAHAFGKALPEGIIPWEDVAPLQRDDPLRLRISRERISHLPPADIAAILDDLDRQTGHELLTAMDNDVLADALEESPADVQVAVLSNLDPERAADILEEMDPDEAADLLADLPETKSAHLLDLMEKDDAADVEALLGYPEETAGGIMTTEFAWVPAGLTAGEALSYLRRSEAAQEDESMHYIYVLDVDERLQHVLTLRDVVMAPPAQPIDEIGDPEVAPITVSPLTPQNDVAYVVAKYDLLAVPVTDETSGKMLGVVTVDDAIDAVLPTAWKKRLPRFS